MNADDVNATEPKRARATDLEIEQRAYQILERLEKGEKYRDFIAELSAPWNVSESTLKRYRMNAKKILKANKHREFLIKTFAQQEAMDEETERKVKSMLERKARLSSIIDGTYNIEREVVIEGEVRSVKRKPYPIDVVRAINTLNKMEEKDAKRNKKQSVVLTNRNGIDAHNKGSEVKELREYMWKLNRKGKPVNEPVKGNDHAIDALRYIVSHHATVSEPQSHCFSIFGGPAEIAALLSRPSGGEEFKPRAGSFISY